jgi:hypothetical protein
MAMKRYQRDGVSDVGHGDSIGGKSGGLVDRLELFLSQTTVSLLLCLRLF